MGLSILTFFQSILLVVNAIAILNEDRLLRRYGLARSQVNRLEQGFKSRSLDMIYSIQTVARVPLLFVNSVVILFKFLPIV